MTGASLMHGAPLKAGALEQLRRVGWGEKWEVGSGWRDTCAPVADSC